MREIKLQIELALAKDEHQPEFSQAVKDVLYSVEPLLKENPNYLKQSILLRMIEPDRQIIFRVPWVDDHNQIRVNRGFRVQFNSILGPYKGGLRFDPSVNLSIMKFLAFEQTFKNALTDLSLGGAKGGSDFNPKGKSDGEIMRFCQSFMTELYRHIGDNIDVPAGDIGVSSREIGYLFGQYKRIKNEFNSAITGKEAFYGGSFLRPQATGYGLLYFVSEMLRDKNQSLEHKRVIISGSGNVAVGALEKAIQLGAKVIAMSDSQGVIIDENGIDLDLIKLIKLMNRESIQTYQKHRPEAQFLPQSDNIWQVECDIALPCATQNELTLKDAIKLVENGCELVAEGANKPTTSDAVDYLQKHLLFGPAKAANSGGVIVSAFEMSQNRVGIPWTAEKIEIKLQESMSHIYQKIALTAQEYNRSNDFVFGANVTAFKRLAQAMIAQGVV